MKPVNFAFFLCVKVMRSLDRVSTVYLQPVSAVSAN